MDGMEHLKQDRQCINSDIVARLRNHCCSANTTVYNPCVVELHFTVDYILSVEQQCFCGKCMSPPTMNLA